MCRVMQGCIPIRSDRVHVSVCVEQQRNDVRLTFPHGSVERRFTKFVGQVDLVRVGLQDPADSRSIVCDDSIVD